MKKNNSISKDSQIERYQGINLKLNLQDIYEENFKAYWMVQEKIN